MASERLAVRTDAFCGGPATGYNSHRRIYSAYLINEDPHFPKIARFREVAGVFTPPRQELRWAGASACQICLGTGLVSDGEGRDWICNCASFGTMPRPALPRGGDVETPECLSRLRLGLARRGDAGGHNHRGPAPCRICGGMRPTH